MHAATEPRSTDGTADTGSGPDDASTEDELDVDELFHLLQNRRRQLVIHYLRERDGPVAMRDLAEWVAAREHDTSVEALRSKERQRVYIPLYQTHLPKLDDAGVIEYDQSRGTVVPNERIQQLYPYLGHADGAGDGSRTALDGDAARRAADSTAYYGSATLFSTGLLALAWAGLVSVSGLVIAAAITTLYTVLTLHHHVGAFGSGGD